MHSQVFDPSLLNVVSIKRQMFAVVLLLTLIFTTPFADAQKVIYDGEHLTIDGNSVTDTEGGINIYTITELLGMQPMKKAFEFNPGYLLSWPGTGISANTNEERDDENNVFYAPTELGFHLDAEKAEDEIFSGDLYVSGIHLKAGKQIKEYALRAAGLKKGELRDAMGLALYAITPESNHGQIVLEYSVKRAIVRNVYWTRDIVVKTQ
jgi:hypothetical protein